MKKGLPHSIAAIAIAIAFGLGCLVSRFLKRPPDRDVVAMPRVAVPAPAWQDKLRNQETVTQRTQRIAPSTLDDVRDSLALFANGDDPNRTQWLVQQQIFNLPEEDVPVALDLLDAHRPFDEEPVIRALFSRWAEFDPAAALEAARTLKNPSMGSIARYEARRAWVVVEPESALAHFEETFRGQPADDLRQMWRALADASPQKAFEMAAKIDDPAIRREREDAIVGAMQWVDPLRAIDWVMQNREGEQQRDKVADILGSWAREDPPEVFRFIGSLPEASHDAELYRQIGQGIGRTKNDGFLDWLEQVPEGHHAAYLGGALGDMVHHHSDQVMELLDQLQEGRPREEVIRDLADRVAELDVGTASQWVATLPRSRSRDIAVREFTRQLGQTDPEAAAIWATDIDDPRLRRGSLQDTVRSWSRKDAAQAAAWIEAQPGEILSEAEKRELTASLQ